MSTDVILDSKKKKEAKIVHLGNLYHLQRGNSRKQTCLEKRGHRQVCVLQREIASDTNSGCIEFEMHEGYIDKNEFWIECYSFGRACQS